MQNSKKNTLVIGGGIIGICVARELQAAGHDVLLIDKQAIGTGCSYANAGWITPCFAMPLPQPGMLLKSIGWLMDSQSPLHIHPSLSPTLIRWLWHFMLAMNHRRMNKSIEVLTAISKHSLNFYEEFSKRSDNTIGFAKNGLLMVTATADGLKGTREEMRLMAEHGIRGQAMDRDELLSFEPMLKPIVKGGVYFPDEAQAEPFDTTQLLAREFTALGGKILTPAEVFDFKISRERRIEEVITTKGRLHPDLVVLAAGSWSPGLAKRLGSRIPLLGGKGYSMSLVGEGRKPRCSMMIVDRKIAVTPRSNSLRLAGTLELVNQDFGISPSRVAGIYSGAQEFLHLDYKQEPTDIWRGLRPCTPDGVPLIGFSKKVSNLFYCAGHQMLGLQSAPGSARLSAELITGATPFTDPKPFSPARFE